MPDNNRKKSFAFHCSVEVFPPGELAALQKHGHRLEALAAGEIAASSEADRHFLLVEKDEADPKTVAERAWLRLKARRELEQADRQKAPLPAPQNYGMVEFDADRCWW